MQADAPALPELRQELRLHAGPHGPVPSWLVYDPVRHRYFQISTAAFELLGLWAPETAEALAARAAAELGRPVDVEEVSELARFIIANNLALAPPQDDARMLARQEAGLQRSWASHVVHSYLYFRIPLVRPHRFLKATLPLVAPLFTRTAAGLILLVSLVGLYFVSRQWDHFVATFLDFLSLEGAFVYALTLVFVKSLHELGHAYTATRAGVRVNTMGVAFMVLTPILYTDVTDAWRLRHRRDKVAIDGAGIVVELALAGVALFLWAFLPDGPLRSAAFVTATTSLILGLAVNLNPLMRFDGYYMLADAWHMPNLQSRSNAMAQWWLREFLFKLRHEPPEHFPGRQRSLLIFYALAVWVYRFFLFLGIALLVYHMFFKVLGIALFVIEIVWFILLPIAHEMKEWWGMRKEIVRTGRSLVTAAVFAGLVAALLVPWSGTVRLQAVIVADVETQVFAPRPARIEAVRLVDEAIVMPGQTLAVLSAPDLEHEAGQTKRRIELLRLRLDRIAGDDTDRADRTVLEGELARHRANLAGLEAERRRLVVRAPHAGVTRDVDRDLLAGEWIDDTVPLARIVQGAASEAKGYLMEEDLWRVEVGALAVFVPEDPLMERMEGKVAEVVGTGTRTIDLIYLASVYGGAVPSDRSAEEVRPRSGRHLVRVRLDAPMARRTVRGTLHLEARRESIAAAMWRRTLQVLVREAGT